MKIYCIYEFYLIYSYIINVNRRAGESHKGALDAGGAGSMLPVISLMTMVLYDIISTELTIINILQNCKSTLD